MTTDQKVIQAAIEIANSLGVGTEEFMTAVILMNAKVEDIYNNDPNRTKYKEAILGVLNEALK